MMKNYAISSLVLVLAALLFTGCVPIWTGDEMRQDIAAIKAEQEATQESFEAEKARLTEMIASARADVAALKEVLKEARALLQRNNADLGVEVQKNRKQMSYLHGELQELEFKVQRLEQDLQLFKEDVDLRFAGSGLAANLPDEAAPLFQQGKKDYEAGNFRAARKAFEKFGENFADHGLAADAQFLLGMTYFRQSQWVTSVFEFQKIIKNYSNSARVDDASYHIAFALMKTGRCDQAAAWFKLLIDEHGNSEWVGEARRHLKSIESGACA
jgi:TolA-binding protein